MDFKYSLVLMLLLVSCKMCTANISEFFYDGRGYIFKFPPECSQILDEFSFCASNFTMCSIQNARPIRLCERCVDHYVSFHDKYKELMNTTVNGTTCRSLFISHDRLDAVLEFHNSIQNIWDKGKCQECFTWTNDTPVISNRTKKFNNMFKETMDCITNNVNPYFNNSDEVCNKCMISYLELDSFYKTLSFDALGIDSVCMDIVDSMNTTRSIWSKSLNCCKLRRSPEIVFLCCTGIISSLPIIFYLAMRYCGPLRDLPSVLRQSRFQQSFLRSRNQRSE